MRRLFCVVIAAILLQTTALSAVKPILLVTPQGVFKSDVTDGVPGPWIPQDIDVIVQGFVTDGPKPPDPPLPPDTDPIVSRVALLSKDLATSDTGRAAAALVDALNKQGLSGKSFVEALHMSAPILDAQLATGGRLTKWAKAVTDITTDPLKIVAGLTKQWGLAASELAVIAEAVTTGHVTDEAQRLDFASIIQFIMMIIELLKNLGIIK